MERGSRTGDAEDGSLELAFPEIYEELRSIARVHWRRVRGRGVLQTTGLVHEVYLRLSRHRLDPKDRNHHLALAARALHRVLIDHVRSERRAKRGGRSSRVTLSGELLQASAPTLDVLALEDALAALGAEHPRRARVVELRFFGGLSVEETAEILGVSARTVKDDWLMARVFLLRRLGSDPDE